MSVRNVDVLKGMDGIFPKLSSLFEVAVKANALPMHDAFEALDVWRKMRSEMAELIDAVDHWCALMPGLSGGPEFDRMVNAMKAARGLT